MFRPVLALGAALAITACASLSPPKPTPVTMTPPPDGEPAAFSAKGQLLWKDLTGASASRRASFDDWRIEGPTLSLVRAGAGTWTGRIRGRDVVVATRPGKVAGGDVDLTVEQDDKGAVIVDGRWAGRPVHFVLATDRIRGAIGNQSIDMSDMGSGMFNSYQGLLQIGGPADMPQIVLALLDVLSP
jgi:hypothetical protein